MEPCEAEGEYEVYRERQDAEYLSDFDRVVEETRRLEGKKNPKALGPGEDSQAIWSGGSGSGRTPG